MGWKVLMFRDANKLRGLARTAALLACLSLCYCGAERRRAEDPRDVEGMSVTASVSEADLFDVLPDPLRTTTQTGFTPTSDRDERPMLKEHQYRSLAALLREVYSQPPTTWPAPHIDPDAEFTELGPVPGKGVFPEDNPYSAAKAELGRMLFFDGRLSGPQQMACASCHVADLGWADGRARSLGHGTVQLERNTPSLLNSGYSPTLFWDGRAKSLEALTAEVLQNTDEMHATPDEIVERLLRLKGYREAFAKAFGDEEITFERIIQAIATHVRTVVSEPSSDFDRFLAGKRDALSDEAVRGLHLFRTDARCVNCHNGPLLTDGRFHNLGLTYYGRKYEDLGRYRVTKDPQDVGRFKTPSLRNVARTAPYMHVGFFDLEGVINIYNAGGAEPRMREEFANDPLYPKKSHHLVPLHLNEQDKRDLLAFLHSLTERRRRDLAPDLPKE